MSWIAELARQRSGRLSWQVLIEFYAVATHPRKLGLDVAAAQADVRALQAWAPIAPDAELMTNAWALQSRYDFSWWDAMIVAAALQAGCETLLSEDMQHGQVIDGGLKLINPFVDDAPQPTIFQS